ncbi:uncharacterized protein LOC119602417 isoform X2 [Lucilia sericata]|uniref:uncharacterized protein LOC119602417 isoform X2 n=1 Tax=Lucilia sericata TaxID=13632 RepID=UPI0018A87A4D|nr:uncharacterized protein LOC119602417 isoform X2 [Lucilia sericata]
MWLENSLLRKNQNIFEFFISTKYLKLDNLLYYGSENKTELPVTQSDLSDGNGLNSNYITHFDSNENDAPNDTIYMICGVVIAMLLVGLIIILVAVTINKLRKRDESITTTAVSIESQQHGRQSRSNSSDNNHYHETHEQIFTNSTAMTDGNDNNSANSTMELETITFARTSGGCNASNGWVFPPKAPSPNISNCVNHDSMITVGERNGFKGFKKQFSGRFKRLVSNKTKDTTSPIPAELKPQLKTIYVY